MNEFLEVSERLPRLLASTPSQPQTVFVEAQIVEGPRTTQMPSSQPMTAPVVVIINPENCK